LTEKARQHIFNKNRNQVEAEVTRNFAASETPSTLAAILNAHIFIQIRRTVHYKGLNKQQ